MKRILVAGSSGFIGGHLVRELKENGHFVIGVDIEEPLYEKPDLFFQYDLRRQDLCYRAFEGKKIDEVYNLACIMGGIGFIGELEHSYDIMVGSSQIVTNILDCCIETKVKRAFYSSSACVYNMRKQDDENALLREGDDYPALPDLVYGWQKLFGEQMYQAAKQTHGLDIAIARFHNIFGEECTWECGKEKAPAAICRKVAEAEDGDAIEIWGDGNQKRSFLHISECIEGIMRLMKISYSAALNIGSDQSISINDLANMIIEISGKNLTVRHIVGTQGVRGRNSDNTMARHILGWQPSKSLREGMEKLYYWVNKQVNG